MSAPLYRGCHVEDLPVPVVQCETFPFGKACRKCEGPVLPADQFLLDNVVDLGGALKTKSAQTGKALYTLMKGKGALQIAAGAAVKTVKGGASMALTAGALALAVAAGGFLYVLLLPKAMKLNMK